MRYPMIGLVILLLATAALAEEPVRVLDIRSPGVLHGESAVPAKAGADTCVLIGPASLAPVVIGTFQDGSGQPDWHGWTSQDWTVPDTTDTSWHVSDYYAVNGVYSAYCGDETIPSCGPGDPVGGYGNSWNKLLKWGAAVADPGQSTHMEVSFAFDVDSETGYDWALVARELEHEAREDIWGLYGDSTGVVTFPITYAPGEYFGEGLDEIGIWFVGKSDDGWSDEDCDYSSTGIWRLDDVTITGDNGIVGVGPVDFEDGTLGPFQRKFLGAFGDFAHLEKNLGDPDICVGNGSPQVTFIDDGVVQPATGASYATTDNRRYADNFVVNHTGGLTFNRNRLIQNFVVSPVIPWQDESHDGLRLGYGYMTDAVFNCGEAGAFMQWWIRSTDGNAASIEHAEWIPAPYLYTGAPHYGRRFWDVSDDLVPGRTHVQMALGATKSYYIWCWPGWIPSPSPYYDNVRLESYAVGGPSLSIDPRHQPQDAFPEIGAVDTADLGRNHIRFDMASNISPAAHEHYHNGDSIVVDAVALRPGAELTQRPLFHYELKRNPLFDPFRTSSLPDSGLVTMDSVHTPAGTLINDRYRVDLPDSGFLFPGDVLHYRFSAVDAIGGAGGSNQRTTSLPANITGWGEFGDDWGWHEEFTVRGLPTVVEDPGNPGAYLTPPILLWDDAESEARGTRTAWYNIIRNLGMVRGQEYDIYYTKAPTTTVGNGLGSRASVDLLSRYRELVYTCGDLSWNTLSNGDRGGGGSDDIGLLEGWLDLGGKDLFLCGTNLADDLNGSGTASATFLNDRMGVSLVTNTHKDLLGGQLAPRVLVAPGNPVLATVGSWTAYGSCPGLLDFDLVAPDGGLPLALWTDPTGVDADYPYSPMTLMIQPSGSRVISMTMDLAHVRADPLEGQKADATMAARSRLLRDVLNYFGIGGPHGWPAPVPDSGVFAAASAPNPFNPVTEIAYSVKAPGHLTMKIYNLRGALVRTLLDRHVSEGGKVAWDGTDSRGGQVASGVYFYEARMGQEVRIGKMALIK